MYLLSTSTLVHRVPVYGKCIISNSLNRTKQIADCCHVVSRTFTRKATVTPHSSFTSARVYGSFGIFPRTNQYCRSILRSLRCSSLASTTRRSFHSSLFRRNGFKKSAEDLPKNDAIPITKVPKKSEIWRLLRLAEPEKYRLAGRLSQCIYIQR